MGLAGPHPLLLPPFLLELFDTLPGFFLILLPDLFG